jgi:outer membrane autotransporter protein
LIDKDGNAISDNQLVAIGEGGVQKATGTYDYRLNTGIANDGLYVAYALKNIDLLSGQTLSLAPDAGAVGLAQDLSASVSGSGNLAIDAGVGSTLSLSNGINSYTGSTTVENGTLQLGNNNVLGKTSELHVSNGATVDMNGKSQQVGQLITDVGAHVTVSGTLTINDAQRLAGVQGGGGLNANTLFGNGSFVIDPSIVYVDGQQAGYTGAVSVTGGSQLIMNNAGAFDNASGINLVSSGDVATFGSAAAYNSAWTALPVGVANVGFSGLGLIELRDRSDITLAGNSNGFAGSFDIGSGSALRAGAAANLGTASITNAGALEINTATDWALINSMSGAGSFTKSGSGTVSIDIANTGMTGATSINGGTLKLTDVHGVGSGDVTVATIAGDSTQGLDLAFDSAASFGNVLSGSGTTQISGTGVTTISGVNSGYVGQWEISGQGALTTSSTVSDQNLGGGLVNITSGGVLTAATSGDFVFNNALTGAGTLSASNNYGAFSFGSGVGSAFAGTVNLVDNTFDLVGSNSMALTNASLILGNGSVTTVGAGTQSIGGLSFNGGTAIFDASVPAQTVAEGVIVAQHLDLSGTGTVQVKVPANGMDNPVPDGSANLLDQDDMGVLTQLAQLSIGGNILGSGANLILQDQNGQRLSAAKTVGIVQNGSQIATGTYDYRVNTGTANDGLYVAYALQSLDVVAGESLILSPNAGANSAGSDLSAQVTGDGGLTIAAGNGAYVSLSNGGNNYKGATQVQSGLLRLDASDALGNTGRLDLIKGSIVDLNGYAQTIGELTSADGTTLNLNNGGLTITNGGTSQGRMFGAGQLNLIGGVLDITGSNASLSAAVAIDASATVNLNDVGGLGTGTLANAGNLNLIGAIGDFSNAVSGTGSVNLTQNANVSLRGDNRDYAGRFSIDSGSTLNATQAQELGSAELVNAGTVEINTSTDWTLINAVSGSGDLSKLGAGTLSAGDALTYTGATFINEGTLVVGDSQNPDRVLGGAGAGEVTVSSYANLAGFGSVTGHVTNNGVISALNALPGFSDAPAGNFTLANGVTNNGVINLAGGSIGNTLTVKGDYFGIKGAVILRTDMGGDNAATDKLILDGGHASGTTGLVIRHGAGEGARTNQGIQLVESRNGATTESDAFTLDSRSDGFRQGAGTISSGAFDYRLKRGGDNGATESWYLVSSTSQETTSEQPSEQSSEPESAPSVVASNTYRPEVGAYLNNKLFVDTMQIHTLHDRIGQLGKDSQNGGESSSWARIERSNSSRDGAGNLKDNDNRYLLHVGTDLLGGSDGKDGSYQVGVMGASGTSSNSSHNDSVSAKGKVTGYSAGVYGTWYGHQDSHTGPYVDTWMMFGRFENEVKGQGLKEEHYQSHNLSTSVEAGYAVPLGDGKNIVVPQAQVIYSGSRAHTHVEENGTQVSGLGSSDFTTRLGARWTQDVDGRGLQPIAELNWWHGPSTQTMTFDHDSVREKLPRDRAEMKFGVSGNLSRDTSLSATMGAQVGGQGYMVRTAEVTLKYDW